MQVRSTATQSAGAAAAKASAARPSAVPEEARSRSEEEESSSDEESPKRSMLFSMLFDIINYNIVLLYILNEIWVFTLYIYIQYIELE